MLRVTANLLRLIRARDPRSRFYFAFVYLVWSILPHFHVLFHSHAGSGPHHHASFSPAQISLANRVIDGLGPAGLAGASEPDVGGEETNAVSVPRALQATMAYAVAGESALAPGRDAFLHGHYWEDANLAGVASLPGFSVLAVVMIAFVAVRYLPPGLRPSGAALARGPPSPFFA